MAEPAAGLQEDSHAAPGVGSVTAATGGIDFHHPFTPYDVQEEFMRAVYDVLEKGDGQVGILESPTGTGKSLSLICAAMTWLRQHKRSRFEATITETANEFKDEPGWIVDQMLKRKREEVTKQWEEKEARLERIRAKERVLEVRGAKRRKVDDTHAGTAAPLRDEDEWMLDDAGENDESQGDQGSGFSKETKSLMEKLGLGVPGKLNDEEEDTPSHDVKIYYTSRTHSQLTQFINELRRPTFPASIPEALLSGNSRQESEGIKHLPLSSRQRLCINPAVSRLGSLSAINDRCAELQKPKSKAKCQFIPSPDSLSQTHQFRDGALATLPDIEDMYDLGKKLSVCPYYASRTAIPGAEIISLPYPLLLQQTAREALGIELEGNVVIIDEAHNIMDAIANVYAAEVSLKELKRGRQMLGVYVKKFGKKLKGENRVMVAQVARVVDGLSEWLEGALGLKSDQGIVDSNALLKPKGVDQINIYKLIQYIQESKLAYKIEGYSAYLEESAEVAYQPSTSNPVLHALLSFLISLTNLSSEGRIFYHRTPSSTKDSPPDIKLSYLLLSPTHAFSSIASSARAVILAGGTMSPFDDYTAHLFPDLPTARITTLSCGHVIPSSNLCVWTLAGTRPGMEFEFSFQKRSDKSMVRELGLAVLNLCGVVPDGVVIFFPSYGYLDEVVQIWSAAQPGQSQQESIWNRLQARKAVFRESKGASSDEVLAAYSEAILGDHSKKDSKATGTTKSKGALLLSVVGGKMSEGINFSDRLGRCVIIVGLPYPNINSPDWKAKIEYIENTTMKRLTTITSGSATNASSASTSDPRRSQQDAAQQAKQVARDFYENACMRAVNQSIGRAIRHKGDYAAIVLVDKRFATPRIRSKLPGWIQGGLVDASEKAGLGQMMGRLGGFFRGKETT